MTEAYAGLLNGARCAKLKDPLVGWDDCAAWATLENVCVEGGGAVDGDGAFWFDLEASRERSMLLDLLWIRGLTVRDLHITRPGFWTIHPTFCDDVRVTGNTVITAAAEGYAGRNTDGCDPDSSWNVYVADNVFETGARRPAPERQKHAPRRRRRLRGDQVGPRLERPHGEHLDAERAPRAQRVQGRPRREHRLRDGRLDPQRDRRRPAAATIFGWEDETLGDRARQLAPRHECRRAPQVRTDARRRHRGRRVPQPHGHGERRGADQPPVRAGARRSSRAETQHRLGTSTTSRGRTSPRRP